LRKPFAKLDDLVRTRRATTQPPTVSPLSRVTGFGPNPGALDAHAFVPAGARALVVALHGCRQDARGYDRGTGWTALAEREGFAVLAPDQNAPNNAWRCFNWFDDSKGEAEAASILAMVEHLVARDGLDPRRVFVTGLSAGGAMAARLLATHPAAFAGGAVIAGLPFGAAGDANEALTVMRTGADIPAGGWAAPVRAASRHRGPWPTLSVWHGAADRTVNPRNGAALVEQWLALHGITWAPRAAEAVDGARVLRWHGADGTPVVESWVIPGLDHAAPIGPGMAEARQRGGIAAPFILDAGIHSTWHIAAGWGLADRARVVEDIRPAAAATGGAPGTATPPSAMPAPMDWARMSPTEVIETAMRLAKG